MMAWWSWFFRTLPILLLWTNISSLLTDSCGTESDRLALLAFKDQISEDPLDVLGSWNDSLHYCQWYGIICGSRRHRSRVTVLDLESQKLEGTFSAHIGNLSFLRIISITDNNFYGSIPQEIGRLFRLKVLSLDGNSFVGNIPANLTRCFSLRHINLSHNKLTGGFPVELTSLSNLKMLNLSGNEFKGSIPSSIGNLSSLTQLLLRDCSLKGSIPDDLCRIRGLKYINIPSNHLTGTIPSCLYNLSGIWYLSVTDNQLHGSIPPDIGLTLRNLEQLFMARNNFEGLIPSSLTNASNLQAIHLGANQLTGQVPKDLGRLKGLQVLVLCSNQFGSTFGDDLSFITSLANSSNLKRFSVVNNSLRGSIPNSIANLSTQLQLLELGINLIHGSIPAGIGTLVNINELDLGSNHLTGEISNVIGVFPKMYGLSLDENQFSGKIPDSFRNSTLLSILNLSGNKLHGSIPTSLAYCKNLFALDLSENYLNGTIPKEVIGLSSLKLLLNLSNNALTGSLPSEVGMLASLQVLDVSSNRLFGNIPRTLGKCLTLVYLDMGDNLFEGEIPHSLRFLEGISYLDLSHNKLTGKIPGYLGNFTALNYLNLSYNELEGPIPNGGVFRNASLVSVVGNSKLCGDIPGLKLLPCNSQTKASSRIVKIVVSVILACLCLVIFSFSLFMCHRRRMSKEQLSPTSFSFHQNIRISYAELLRATNNFSSDHLVGVGSYGSVFKGTLDRVNTSIAVKVFNLQREGASTSFLSECHAMGSARHRNLLKLITSCSSLDFHGNEFKALIFEFMSNGNLDEWLHPLGDNEFELRNLNFLQRLNIAIDIASAVDYLHNHCQPPIVHCDLKPSNVLLNDDMVAHVADFGLAKIFCPTSSVSLQLRDNSLAIKGSIGYVAPEYGMGSEVSLQGDVYSYGILLLEMFINKRPTEAMFQNGLSLRMFANKALSEHVMEIVDPSMFLEEFKEPVDTENKSDRRGTVQECLISLLRIGVSCSAESPMNRMDMSNVVTQLYHIKEYYQGVGIHLG